MHDTSMRRAGGGQAGSIRLGTGQSMLQKLESAGMDLMLPQSQKECGWLETHSQLETLLTGEI